MRKLYVKEAPPGFWLNLTCILQQRCVVCRPRLTHCATVNLILYRKMFRLGIQFCAVVWCPTYLATTGAARAAYWPTNENRENIRKKIASWKQLSNMVPNMFRRCFLRIITLQTQRMFILIILFFLYWSGFQDSRFPDAAGNAGQTFKWIKSLLRS